MEKTFARNLESLAALYEFADAVMASGSVGDAVRYPVQLAMEELFVNMVKYNPDVFEPIAVSVAATGGKVEVAIVDDGGAEFDVTRSRDVNIAAPLAERTPGGLGIHLVQTLVDDLEYSYTNGRGTVRFSKEASNDDV